jgi:hypothetical protein
VLSPDRRRDDLTGVESEQIAQVGPNEYSLSLIFTPADTGPFAALTGKLAGLPSPRDHLAIIISGRVVAHPVVVAAMLSHVQITGLAALDVLPDWRWCAARSVTRPCRRLLASQLRRGAWSAP